MIENTGKGEYSSLYGVLLEALQQASSGKGYKRHSEPNEAFENQVICEITQRLRKSSLGYPLGQAVKKIYETVNITNEEAINELLGAINYIAAAIISLREYDKINHEVTINIINELKEIKPADLVIDTVIEKIKQDIDIAVNKVFKDGLTDIEKEKLHLTDSDLVYDYVTPYIGDTTAEEDIIKYYSEVDNSRLTDIERERFHITEPCFDSDIEEELIKYYNRGANEGKD